MMTTACCWLLIKGSLTLKNTAAARIRIGRAEEVAQDRERMRPLAGGRHAPDPALRTDRHAQHEQDRQVHFQIREQGESAASQRDEDDNGGQSGQDQD